MNISIQHLILNSNSANTDGHFMPFPEIRHHYLHCDKDQSRVLSTPQPAQTNRIFPKLSNTRMGNIEAERCWVGDVGGGGAGEIETKAEDLDEEDAEAETIMALWKSRESGLCSVEMPYVCSLTKSSVSLLQRGSRYTWWIPYASFAISLSLDLERYLLIVNLLMLH
jgi:hypothetical protein